MYLHIHFPIFPVGQGGVWDWILGGKVLIRVFIQLYVKEKDYGRGWGGSPNSYTRRGCRTVHSQLSMRIVDTAELFCVVHETFKPSLQ